MSRRTDTASPSSWYSDFIFRGNTLVHTDNGLDAFVSTLPSNSQAGVHAQIKNMLSSACDRADTNDLNFQGMVKTALSGLTDWVDDYAELDKVSIDYRPDGMPPSVRVWIRLKSDQEQKGSTMPEGYPSVERLHSKYSNAASRARGRGGRRSSLLSGSTLYAVKE